MVSHQYKIRLEKEKSEKIDFDIKDVSLKNTFIKQIDKPTAKKNVEEYDWLKSIPLVVRYNFGLFFKINNKEYLGGVLMFGDDYAQNTGNWGKYGFGDKMLLLSRGVCLWWTPKNSASFFISKACRWIKENTKYRIITATVDPAAGEIGTIYQSLNWHYVGLMSGNYHNKKETKRLAYIINGKIRYSRWIKKHVGSLKKSDVLDKFPNAIYLPQYRKRRYFYFMDNKTENRKYYNNIKHLIQPYPKRDDKNVCGIIYQITNKINNKIYIGQTTRNLIDRIEDYKRGYGNSYLNNSFSKYGFENFEFKIIDIASTIHELNTKEVYYIIHYDTTNKNKGYNMLDGGDNKTPNDETRNKISKSNKGKKQSPDWVKKRIPQAGSEEAKKYGKPKTDAEKKYLSENSPKYWEGKQMSDETKKKISETKKMRGMSQKTINSICKSVYIYNPSTKELVNKYISTGEASKDFPQSQSTISRYCAKDKIVDGLLFSYKEKFPLD